MPKTTAKPAKVKALSSAKARKVRVFLASPSDVSAPKHVAEPAGLSEITRTLGVTKDEIRRVDQVLSRLGYLK